jgi:hypothetical protein
MIPASLGRWKFAAAAFGNWRNLPGGKASAHGLGQKRDPMAANENPSAGGAGASMSGFPRRTTNTEVSKRLRRLQTVRRSIGPFYVVTGRAALGLIADIHGSYR